MGLAAQPLASGLWDCWGSQHSVNMSVSLKGLLTHRVGGKLIFRLEVKGALIYRWIGQFRDDRYVRVDFDLVFVSGRNA